jgi:bifunctional UDP-N-acetylglucosamine pyrophosphorylase/glucosamine-1-phosphate N-acetyltransferase
VIGRGSTIGPDTTLVDCEVGENAVVKRTDGTLAVIGAAHPSARSPT